QQTQRGCPSVAEITRVLHTLRTESSENWNELVKSITAEVALLDLTIDQRTLLGGTLVSWTLEQWLERALHFAIHNRSEDCIKEISNTPHSNWTPFEYIPWLILELEMNITIREIQVKVARHMMDPHARVDADAVK
ncbi:unnamed protein product, partial [Didymodactylos carnosus]